MSYKLKLVSTALVMRIRIMSNEYFHTHADGNKRLDFQQHPLMLKVTQPNGTPGCNDDEDGKRRARP